MENEQLKQEADNYSNKPEFAFNRGPIYRAFLAGASFVSQNRDEEIARLKANVESLKQMFDIATSKAAKAEEEVERMKPLYEQGLKNDNEHKEYVLMRDTVNDNSMWAKKDGNYWHFKYGMRTLSEAYNIIIESKGGKK